MQADNGASWGYVAVSFQAEAVVQVGPGAQHITTWSTAKAYRGYVRIACAGAWSVAPLAFRVLSCQDQALHESKMC